MVPYRPERVVVQSDAWNDPLTREVLQRLPGVPTSTVGEIDSLLPELHAGIDFRTTAKRTLILARNRGSFMKECPGAGAEICCNYVVINFALNCHLECTYCVLQAFLNNPALTVYTNVEDLMSEVEAKVRQFPARTFRIGTGETADSLGLDDITWYSRRLVPFFRSLPNAVLELKTKTAQIANLRDVDHGGHTIVSWSLNPESIIRAEEHKTASLAERICAARQCQEWGYRVGFHFDPMIHYRGWEADYEGVVRELFRQVDPEGVTWISLGCLRFTPHLKDIVRERFPKSRISYGEFVPGNHGKLRYFRPIRDEMYAKMRAWIGAQAPSVLVYLCMENHAAWERSFDAPPESSADLAERMDAKSGIRGSGTTQQGTRREMNETSDAGTHGG
jgi:spore photoproduct lyase